MLWQRAQEEIVQSEKEMQQFIQSIEEHILKIKDERSAQLLLTAGDGIPWLVEPAIRQCKSSQIKAIIMSLEIDRLIVLRNEALVYYKKYASFNIPLETSFSIEESDNEESDNEL
jgi:hypothetical protein